MLTVSNLDGVFTNDVVSTIDCTTAELQFTVGSVNAASGDEVLIGLNGQSDITSGWQTAVVVSGAE